MTHATATAGPAAAPTHAPPAPPAVTGPPPGPKGIPLLGSLFDMGRDPLGFVTQVSRAHGDLAMYTLGPVRSWLVTHPDGIESVLVHHRDQMHKDTVTNGLSRLLGNGLLTAEDPLWRRQRKLAAPSFQPRHLAAYAEAMVDATVRSAETVPDGRRDVHEDMTAITFEIVLRTLFGTRDLLGEQVGASIATFMVEFEREVRSFRRMLPPWVPTTGRWRIRRARATIGAALDRVIEAHRAAPPSDDLLGRLLAARDEDGSGMSDQQIHDEAVTLFLAGHETTALTLSYSLWLIAQHEDVQDQLRQEREAVLGDRLPTMADVQKLALHDAVIKESMRLYPPAWMVGRTPLAPVEVLGRTIGVGDQILMPQWVVHRDPRWWSQPEAFRPERFLGDEASRESARVPRFAYYPFGGGPRVCVGNHFAAMESVLVLATWLRDRRVRPAAGATLELMPAVTLRPRNGVHLDVSR